jgi:flagellar secretion chaperone FliS
MAMLNPYQQYAQTQINSTTPEELTLMLYKGAVKFILIGIRAVEEKNIQESHNSIIKAQKIYFELLNTLDPKYPISENLSSLYNYIIRVLTEANVKKDKAMLEEVLEMSKEFVVTWEEAVKIYRRSQAPTEWVK